MANWTALKAAIAAVIKTNGNQEITGAVLQSTLNTIVSNLGENATFKGIATPTTVPGTPDGNLFYIAYEKGIYANFNAIDITDDDGLVILLYSSDWNKINIPLALKDELVQVRSDLNEIEQEQIQGGIYDVSSHNDGAVFESLSALLGSANLSTFIPISVRRGGMTIKFIQGTEPNSGNKYVQYRLTGDEFTTDTTQWVIADEGVYVENPEFVYVKTDSEGKILLAIKTDGGIYYGAGCPQQVKEYIEEKLAEFSPDEYEDIVAFLSDYLGSDTTLKTLLDSKLDAEGLDPEALGTVQALENPEYIQVTTDSEDKILEGITSDGAKQINIPIDTPSATIEHIDNSEFIDIETDGEGKILSSRNNKGVKKEYVAIETPQIITDLIDSKELSSKVYNVSDKINLSNNAKEKLKEDLSLNETPEYSFDIANGNLQAFGTYKSELEASPIINDESKHYVGYSSSQTKIRKKNTSKVIVGINHDDLYPSDYVGNRKIYNKYGFNANFNYIIRPFWNKQEQDQKVREVKKMVEDGNTIGLHTMWGSYWMTNRLFDVTPNGNSLFAPALSDLRGNNPDGTGINAWGVNIASNTTVIECGYTSSPKYGDTKVVELTETQVNEINREYTIYGNTCSDGGLDLSGAQAGNKKYLWWLEYWYNNLIDDTLGYSSDSEVITERFAEDYDVPSGSSASDYYPDKEHLISGKIVFYDDTSNPHYNDAEYQKVGRFKKGLFKGCASCCNYEVMDRSFKIANAFLKYYFGFDSVKHYSPHGQFYFSKFAEQGGIKYFDANHNFALSYRTKMYMSRHSSFISAADIMLSMGIRSSYLASYSNIIIDKLLYSDCCGKLPDCFNGWIHGDYLNSIGTDKWLGVSYSDFSTFMDGIDNWTEFLFENAGKTVTRNGVTLKVFTILRDFITIINSAIGTGIIPAFGVDTIITCPNMSIATELLLRYCYKEGIDVVPFSMLSSIAQSSSSKGEIIKDNYFPNPMFNQSILRSVGNVSMAVPDGWAIESTAGSPVVSVENTENSMTVFTNTVSKAVIYSKICNLPSGTYSLKFKISGTDNPSGTINVHKVINGDTGINEDNKILSVSTTSSYSEETVNFQVPVYHRNPDNRSSVINQICDGYEDNFAFLYIEIICQNGASLTIKECSIKKV